MHDLVLFPVGKVSRKYWDAEVCPRSQISFNSAVDSGTFTGGNDRRHLLLNGSWEIIWSIKKMGPRDFTGHTEIRAPGSQFNSALTTSCCLAWDWVDTLFSLISTQLCHQSSRKYSKKDARKEVLKDTSYSPCSICKTKKNLSVLYLQWPRFKEE